MVLYSVDRYGVPRKQFKSNFASGIFVAEICMMKPMKIGLVWKFET